MKKNTISLFILFSFNTLAIETVPFNINYKAPEFSLSGMQIDLSQGQTISEAVKKKYRKPITTAKKKPSSSSDGEVNLYKNISNEEFKNDESISEILKNIKTEKKLVQNEERKPDYDNDGLIMFDYSKNTNDVVKTKSNTPQQTVVDSIQTVASAPISNPLKAVIEREMLDINMSKLTSKATVVSTPQIASFSKASSGSSNLIIKAMEVTLSGDNVLEDLNSFQLQTPFHEDQIMTSDLSGNIAIDTLTGVLRGTLLYNNAVATRVELPVDSEGGLYRVPLLTYQSVRKYMDENKLEGHGGHYLVEVGENVADIDIELSSTASPYELRVLFDEAFNEVKQGEDFRYILFFGINPGNVTVKTIGYNGEFADKIALVTPDEVLFDYLEIKKEKAKKYSLVVNNTMSVVPSGINVDSNKIKTIIGSGDNKKVSESKYQYSSYPKILGMKEYLELDFLNDKIYFSLGNEKQINIPSNEFISEVLTQFEVDALEDRCIVQINLNNELLGLQHSLESDMGHESAEILFLDKDGIFTDEISPLTKKVFVMGNRQGVINLKLTNVKEENTYQRTFCSTATYLVEHF